ncbi:MAG: glycosyltransferase family 4 protein [Acidobacteria bacterium]|nr:glycosyltransferase family 4 protein [Acidobacteriota bacterium]
MASTVVPFLYGGYTVIVDSLADELARAGHEVEVLKFPFSSHHEELMEQMTALRLLDLTEHGDRLITIRFPSYLLRHPKKVVWFIHHHRGAYDLWGTCYQDIPLTPEGTRIRDSIMNADRLGLSECHRVFSNSKVVAKRLKQYNSIDAEVLYPPLPQAANYNCAGYGDTVLYLNRLVHHKRQWLAIEAMRHVRTDVKLLIAGKADPDSSAYVDELHALVHRHKLKDRVTIFDDWIDENRKCKLFAECLAAAYFPVDEDSYGYPSLEAHQSGKAVLTTADSGGTLELIVDGRNGLIAAPEPVAIAAALDELYTNRARTQAMGEAGIVRMRELGISWDHVLDRMLS